MLFLGLGLMGKVGLRNVVPRVASWKKFVQENRRVGSPCAGSFCAGRSSGVTAASEAAAGGRGLAFELRAWMGFEVIY